MVVVAKAPVSEKVEEQSTESKGEMVEGKVISPDQEQISPETTGETDATS